MTKEEQHIAIAKATGVPMHARFYYQRAKGSGWRNFKTRKDAELSWERYGLVDYPVEDVWIPEMLPDYTGNLNAMHEAEKVLTIAQRIQYKHQIGVVMSGGSVGRAIPDWWLIHEASPAQRAEALLRTLNLWIDPTSTN